jgi:UDP-glucuronate decarboxylase
VRPGILPPRRYEILVCDDGPDATTRACVKRLALPPLRQFRTDAPRRHPSTLGEADEIYILACPASPIHYQYEPVQTTKTSVHGAINTLRLAKRAKAKDLVFLVA